MHSFRFIIFIIYSIYNIEKTIFATNSSQPVTLKSIWQSKIKKQLDKVLPNKNLKVSVNCPYFPEFNHQFTKEIEYNHQKSINDKGKHVSYKDIFYKEGIDLFHIKKVDLFDKKKLDQFDIDRNNYKQNY